MSDTVAGAEASKPLSQWERVVDTFIAPSKTFTDILRDTSWWLPWLLGVLFTLSFGVAIQQKIGWDKTYANILLQSSQSQLDRLAQLPPDQQARQKAIGASFVKYIFWSTPILGLLFAAIAASRSTGDAEFRVGRPRDISPDVRGVDVRHAAIPDSGNSLDHYHLCRARRRLLQFEKPGRHERGIFSASGFAQVVDGVRYRH